MNILLTGGLGFIGSNLYNKLAEDKNNFIVIFDSATNEKIKNLKNWDPESLDYVDKEFLLHRLSVSNWIKQFDIIIHLGATSSTTCVDKSIIENNYQLSKDLIGSALDNHIPIIFASSASVYGKTQSKGSVGSICPESMYAASKAFTDNAVLRVLKDKRQTKENFSMIVGLRFYNVYGPRESHKGIQASVIHGWYKSFRKSGIWEVFEGENKRDFIHVNDIVKCILWFANNIDSKKSGIYDLGTGVVSDFVEISDIMEEKLNAPEAPRIPIPDSLKGQYQTFTRADLDPLRSIGYDEPFTDLKTGVASYVDYLKENK